MMGDTNTRLPLLDPLLAQSARDGTRVRLVLRQTDGDAHPARIVEGIVLEVVTGRDNRPRLRMGIPTGSGDPVEVRVLLHGVERVERVDAPPSAAEPATPRSAARRATIAFGTDPSIQRGVPHNDSRDDDRADADRKNR
jgi:hypothetical protein